MNIAFIFKGTHSNNRKIKKVLAITKSSELFNIINKYESQYAGNSIEIARVIAPENNYVIAVGGDGTLNEVVNGIMQYHQENPSETLPILGVLPLGTANDFVKSINHKKGIDALLVLIKNQHYHSIDLGKLQCNDEDRISKITRYFINIADVGFGAHVVQKTNSGNSLFGANYTYIKAILSTFLSYKPKLLSLNIDDQAEQKQRALSIVFANGKYFGSGLGIAPHAQLADGKLAITHIGNVSMFDFLFYLGALKKGKKLSHPEAKYLKATKITIRSEDKHAAVEADGEFIGYLPVTAEVIPAKILFLMP